MKLLIITAVTVVAAAFVVAIQLALGGLLQDRSFRRKSRASPRGWFLDEVVLPTFVGVVIMAPFAFGMALVSERNRHIDEGQELRTLHVPE